MWLWRYSELGLWKCQFSVDIWTVLKLFVSVPEGFTLLTPQKVSSETLLRMIMLLPSNKEQSLSIVREVLKHKRMNSLLAGLAGGREKHCLRWYFGINCNRILFLRFKILHVQISFSWMVVQVLALNHCSTWKGSWAHALLPHL